MDSGHTADAKTESMASHLNSLDIHQDCGSDAGAPSVSGRHNIVL